MGIEMFCPHCGNRSQGERICPGCGKELPKRPGSGAADSLIGRTLDQKYQLEARLGVDATGTVYRAKRLLIGDIVAVKILDPDLMNNERAVTRFKREAQSSALIKHPNVVAIYDFRVTSDKLVYLVMELVVGVSLRKMIEQQGALPEASAVMIASQVCSTLAEAHKHGVIHRDLRPENILIQNTGNRQQVKVLNFGIAALSDLNIGDAEQPGLLVNAEYMSPEQCVGETLDVRSDIYSLGILLYEMLTGVTPFKSPVPTAVVVQQVNQAPIPLRRLNSDISPAIESAVLRALHKRRERRPQSATEFANLLTKSTQGAVSPVRTDQPLESSPIPEPVQSLPDTDSYAVSDVAPASGNQTVASERSSNLGWWLFGAVLLLIIGTGIWWYAKTDKVSPLTNTTTDTVAAQPAAPTDPPPQVTPTSSPEPASNPVPPVTRGSLWELVAEHTSGTIDAENALGSPDQRVAVIAPGNQIALAYRGGQFFGNGPGADLHLHVPAESASYEIFVRNDSVSTWRRIDINRRASSNGVFNHDIGHHGVQQARQVMIKNSDVADLKLDAVTAQYNEKVIRVATAPKVRPRPRPVYVDRKELEKARKKRQKELEKRRKEREERRK
jgi:serine/threonine-protein kinase